MATSEGPGTKLALSDGMAGGSRGNIKLSASVIGTQPLIELCAYLIL